MLQQLLRIVAAGGDGELVVRRHAFAIAHSLISVLATLLDGELKGRMRAIVQVTFTQTCLHSNLFARAGAVTRFATEH